MMNFKTTVVYFVGEWISKHLLTVYVLPKKLFPRVIIKNIPTRNLIFTILKTLSNQYILVFKVLELFFVISGNRGNDHFFYNKEKRYKSETD